MNNPKPQMKFTLFEKPKSQQQYGSLPSLVLAQQKFYGMLVPT